MSEILEIVMDIQNDIRLSNFLREFNTKISQGMQASSGKLLLKKKSMRKSSKQTVYNFIGARRSGKVESGTAKTLQLFEKQMDDKKLDLEVLSWSDYVCINLYLMLYKDEDLIRKG
jgi:hypothetical protein